MPFTGRSPFATWTINFDRPGNEWLDLSKIREVQLTFDGYLLGANRARANAESEVDGLFFAQKLLMSEEKSTEEQTQKIDAIVGDEVLGYEGSAQPEHSGQTSPEEGEVTDDALADRLADNRADQVK